MTKAPIPILGLGIFSLMLLGCQDTKLKKTKEVFVKFNKEAVLEIYDESEQLVIQYDVELADTPYERQTGLMYRTSMRSDQGMLFVFDQPALRSFYMKNTPLSLDLLFLNERLEIVSIYKDATPNDLSPISSQKDAKYVLELLSGEIKKWGLTLGMNINYTKL
ncbi:MAG: DUF192 domain-containing protein [Flavobacteriaceae bacterium]